MSKSVSGSRLFGCGPVHAFGDVDVILRLAFDFSLQVLQAALHHVVDVHFSGRLVAENFRLVGLGNLVDEQHEIVGRRARRARC